MSQSHSKRWRSQENRSCLSQLFSFSALNYDFYYLLTGFPTLPAGSKHSKGSRSLLQRTDRLRESKICKNYTNLLLHFLSERADGLTTLSWLLPSSAHQTAVPAVLHLCASALSSAVFNCQDLMANAFPMQPNLSSRPRLPMCCSSKWSFAEAYCFSLGGPCSLHVLCQVSRQCHRLLHWPCHFKTDCLL